MQAENRKFQAGQKFVPPKKLDKAIQVLYNYICWLEVMFGYVCPHLLQVVRLRDALDDNQDVLDLALDKYLLLTILWRVHKDARRYFDKAEKWNHGEPLPTSNLRGMVDLLEYDQQMSKSLTCPFDDFFNEKKTMPGEGGGGRGNNKRKTKEGDITPESVALFVDNIGYQERSGFCKVVTWDELVKTRPPQLKISPVAVVPQTDRQGRIILDLSFPVYQEVNGDVVITQASVKKTTSSTAPTIPVKEIGKVLNRLLHFMKKTKEGV
jgi:hypothetical protein